MPSTRDLITIYYRRPPASEEIFVQRLVRRTADAVITFVERVPLARPLITDGRVRLEPDAPVVWFSFPGARHDIGRFHRTDGTFTGIYANILTPVEGLDGSVWHTTDLFLDLWIPAGGTIALLDADELAAAEAAGHVDRHTALEATAEAERLLGEASAGRWPPAIVDEWSLERVLAELS